MKNSSIYIWLLLVSISTKVIAQQKKTFDIFSYNTPKSFVLKDNKDKLFFTKTEGNSYSQIFLYPAVIGESDAEKDFNKNWDFFARNAAQGVNSPETKDAGNINGWKMVFGAAKGTYNNQQFVVTISTFTKGFVTYFIASVFTDQKHSQLAQDFIAGVIPDENKFVNRSNQQYPQNKTIATNNPNSMGISKLRTNFDDGWIATTKEDFVQLTKNGSEVRLYFPDGQIDANRPKNTNTFESYYWDVVVKNAFTAGQPFLREKEQYSYGKEDIWEGNVTEKITQRKYYIGMRLVFINGSCLAIIAMSPDKNTYYSLFNKDEDFTNKLAYNKFAVAKSDIIGKWSSFNAGSMQYYNIYNGNYAGMNTVSSSDKFQFFTNGTYQSEHLATSVFNGSVASGKSMYKGTFNVNQWQLTATNRNAGKQDDFTCQFEAIKGGYLLKLINKKYTGEVLSLFKIK